MCPIPMPTASAAAAAGVAVLMVLGGGPGFSQGRRPPLILPFFFLFPFWWEDIRRNAPAAAGPHSAASPKHSKAHRSPRAARPRVGYYSPSAPRVGKHACPATAIQAILIIAVHKACIPMMRADGKVQAFAAMQGVVWDQTLPKMKIISVFCEL